MLLLGNFDTQSWAADDQVDAYSAEIKIGFRNGDQNPVIFDNLSFGFDFFSGEESLFSGSYPPVNVFYKSSDQEYVVAEVVNNLTPEESYTLNVWVQNAGQRFEESIIVTTSRPLQPYESWIYDSEKRVWVAPVQYPTDGEDYVWNEESQSWDPFTTPSE
jgi:hypothetical protein